MDILNIYMICLRPIVAQGYKRAIVNVTCFGFDSQLEELKYVIFSFLHSGNEAKRDIEFCHLTHKASRM